MSGSTIGKRTQARLLCREPANRGTKCHVAVLTWTAACASLEGAPNAGSSDGNPQSEYLDADSPYIERRKSMHVGALALFVYPDMLDGPLIDHVRRHLAGRLHLSGA